MDEGKKLWGGRFEAASDPDFAAFNRSFDFDQRLFDVDVQASLAYCNALLNAGVITPEETAAIRSGLEQIQESAKLDARYFADASVEDVHTFVEVRLVELIGDAGRKLHTGRSRNDQVATDFRLWTRQAIDDLKVEVKQAQSALLAFAEANRQVAIPGYTHLQRAQPVLLAHWCLAYFEMLGRDSERMDDVRRRVNVMPLGAAALAGSAFPLDREMLARDLGFASVTNNSLDAVSDRDFCVEFVSACSLVILHLSRLAEDIILYTTTEFGFFELSDAISTGSSLMPQKKNPDAMELVRGKAGRVFGDLQGLLVLLKGLPLAYNKDMQEDKEAVFDAFATVRNCLRITATVLKNIAVNQDRCRTAASTGYMNATELADYLVRKGMPFREAHSVAGRVVMRAIELGKELEQLDLPELKKFSELFDEDIYDCLTIEQTLRARSLSGGTSPETVEEALANARLKV